MRANKNLYVLKTFQGFTYSVPNVAKGRQFAKAKGLQPGMRIIKENVITGKKKEFSI